MKHIYWKQFTLSLLLSYTSVFANLFFLHPFLIHHALVRGIWKNVYSCYRITKNKVVKSNQRWELCDFTMCMGSCFYPIAHVDEVTGCWEVARFSTPLFSTDVNTGHGIISHLPSHELYQGILASMIPAENGASSRNLPL